MESLTSRTSSATLQLRSAQSDSRILNFLRSHNEMDHAVGRGDEEPVEIVAQLLDFVPARDAVKLLRMRRPLQCRSSPIPATHRDDSNSVRYRSKAGSGRIEKCIRPFPPRSTATPGYPDKKQPSARMCGSGT